MHIGAIRGQKAQGPVSSKCVRFIFVVNSSYFQLLFIRFAMFVRRNLFDEIGPRPTLAVYGIA